MSRAVSLNGGVTYVTADTASADDLRAIDHAICGELGSLAGVEEKPTTWQLRVGLGLWLASQTEDQVIEVLS